MSSIEVKNIKIEDNSPSITDPELIKLLSTRLKSEKASFELYNVNIGISNGIRRTLISSVPARAMNIKEEDFSSDDPYLLSDFIIQRIRQVPIDQSTPISDRFELIVENNTTTSRNIKTSEIKRSKGSGILPFNENITICELGPNRKINLKNIYIDEGVSYQQNGGGYKLACSCSCIPLDQIPYDPYTEKGIKSTLSDPQAHRIHFITNGTINCKKLIKMACEIMIDKMNLVIENLKYLEQVPNLNMYQLNIKGESDTIGNMIVKTVSVNNPDINAITYSVNRLDRNLEIRIKTDNNAKQILTDAANNNIMVLKKIISYF